MDSKSASINPSNLTNCLNNMRSKLRRLRIQEALLLQSIQKPDRYLDEDTNIDTDFENRSTVSYKSVLEKVRSTFINLKNLYDEVKTNTQSQELLVELDLDDLKKKVFELESHIKAFKSEVGTELAALEIAEQNLIYQLNENPTEIDNIKRGSKTHSVNYNKIVPSPVRVLMTSPLKCSEVQQFQDFMKESPNRYGGWNEYNHNIFVRYWQKFFGKNYCCELEDENFQQSITYTMFKEDLTPKLQGITENDITTHTKWYIKYVFLKEMQQNAINKWKANKLSTRNMPQMVKSSEFEGKDIFLAENSIDSTFIACHLNASQSTLFKDSKAPSTSLTSKFKSTKQERTHNIMKPTKQWLNRNSHTNDTDDKYEPKFNCIENMEKLRTPHWRLRL